MIILFRKPRPEDSADWDDMDDRSGIEFLASYNNVVYSVLHIEKDLNYTEIFVFKEYSHN